MPIHSREGVHLRKPTRIVRLLIGGLLVLGCGSNPENEVRMGGSSTLFPLLVDLAEESKTWTPPPQVSVMESGTVAGLSALCEGEMDLAAASWAMPTFIEEKCARNGIRARTVPVGVDGVAVITDFSNTDVHSLSIPELKRIWDADHPHPAETWSALRPQWPDLPITRYSSGRNSGTFQTFLQHILGEGRRCRTDTFEIESDALLRKAVSREPGAIGVIGYLRAVGDEQLRILAVSPDPSAPAIYPTRNTITGGTYPFRRVLSLVTTEEALQKPAVQSLLQIVKTKGRNAYTSPWFLPLAQDGENLP